MAKNEETYIQTTCITEHVNPDLPDMTCVSLPQLIFEMDDIALIACGSLTCIRGIYLTAYRQNALNRFYYRIINPSAYACGLAGQQIKELITGVLDKVRPGAIIYYASCMETLMKLDFDKIVSTIDNPGHVPIHILFRGPMVNRYMDTRTELASILLKIPYSGRPISRKINLLPPVMPDFAAVTEMMQGMGTYNFLVTPGGCDGCLAPLPDRKRAYQLTKSRLDDISVASGSEQSIAAGMKRDYSLTGEGRMAAISGTAVPKVTGFYYGGLQNTLQKSEISSILFQTDSFHTSCEGISGAYLAMAKTFCTQSGRRTDEEEEIGILGAHPYASADPEHLRYAIHILKKSGYSVYIPEEQNIGDFARLSGTIANWVVSAEGIPAAQNLKENFDIPYVTFFPVGAYAVQCWLRMIRSGSETGETCRDGVPDKRQKGKMERCLLIGDPVLTAALAGYLSCVYHLTGITRAVYSCVPSETMWYEKTLRMTDLTSQYDCGGIIFPDVTFFSSVGELRKLVRRADIIIADRCLTDTLQSSASLKKKIMVDLPDPAISLGIRPENSSYEIFGVRGAEWLERQTGLIVEEEFENSEFLSSAVPGNEALSG